MTETVDDKTDFGIGECVGEFVVPEISDLGLESQIRPVYVYWFVSTMCQ